MRLFALAALLLAGATAPQEIAVLPTNGHPFAALPVAGGVIVSEGGTDGACVSSCTVVLSSSGRAGLLAGWRLVPGPAVPRLLRLVSSVRTKQKGRGSRVGFRGPEGAGLILYQAGSLQGSGPRKAHIVWCCVVCFLAPAPAAAASKA